MIFYMVHNDKQYNIIKTNKNVIKFHKIIVYYSITSKVIKLYNYEKTNYKKTMLFG